MPVFFVVFAAFGVAEPQKYSAEQKARGYHQATEWFKHTVGFAGMDSPCDAWRQKLGTNKHQRTTHK